MLPNSNISPSTPGQQAGGGRVPSIPTPEQLAVIQWMKDANPSHFHPWILSAANRCQRAGFDTNTAFHLIRGKANDHSRPVPNEEILRTIHKAYGSPGQAFTPTVATGARTLHPIAKMAPDAKLRVLRQSPDWPQGFTLQSLLESQENQVKFIGTVSPGILLQMLFGMRLGRNLRIVLARKVEQGLRHQNLPLDQVIQNPSMVTDSGFHLVVPNLAVAQWGRTQDGKPSERALDLFPHRHYLVLESDLGPGTWDLQAALIAFTARVLEQSPVLVVHSGNKSLHSWWRAEVLQERPLCDFIDNMAGLLDPASKTRNQCFRLPNANRSPHEKLPNVCQQVLYADARELLAAWKSSDVGKK